MFDKDRAIVRAVFFGRCDRTAFAAAAEEYGRFVGRRAVIVGP